MISSAIPARRRLRSWVCVLAACIWLGCSLPAWGLWMSTPAPPELMVTTATLEPPGAPTASIGECIAGVSIKVNLSWSATASEFAEGYDISRSTTPGGPYSKVGAVIGVGTTTLIDTSADFLTTYYYVVQATKNNWRSLYLGETSVTTPAPFCS